MGSVTHKHPPYTAHARAMSHQLLIIRHKLFRDFFYISSEFIVEWVELHELVKIHLKVRMEAKVELHPFLLQDHSSNQPDIFGGLSRNILQLLARRWPLHGLGDLV